MPNKQRIFPDYHEVKAMYNRGEPDGWEPVKGKKAFVKKCFARELRAAGYELPPTFSDDDLVELETSIETYVFRFEDEVIDPEQNKVVSRIEIEGPQEILPRVIEEEFGGLIQVLKSTYVDPMKSIGQAIKDMSQSLKRDIVVRLRKSPSNLWEIKAIPKKRPGGRPPLKHITKGLELVDNGMTPPEAFAKLVENGDISIEGATNFEYQRNYEEEERKFSESIKKRKSRRGV